MAKVRVYELAMELGIESKAVMARLRGMGEIVRSASSTIEAPVVRRLVEAFAAEGVHRRSPSRSAPVRPLPMPGPMAVEQQPSATPPISFAERPAAPGPRPAAPAKLPWEEEVAGQMSDEDESDMSDEDVAADADERNIVYFENSSMWELYVNMEDWQDANNRRLLSITVQRDHGKYCCIAFADPMDSQEYDADGQEYNENDQEYNEDEWKYDMDSIWASRDDDLAQYATNTFTRRAANGWELVSSTSYYYDGVVTIYLFWRRTAS